MAGTITHQWNGTILTITSDSGTSSSDLKGAKGDDGPRGAQGAPGSSVAEDSQKLGGVAAAQYALKNGVPAHNLLDNSDFRNPVNQRGKTSYSASGYTIDRWYLYDPNGDGTVTINNGYISLTGGSGAVSLSCRFPKGFLDANKTYTARICDNLGNINPTGLYFWDSFDSFELSAGAGETKNIAWAALYEGAYDASTLPAYQPKGYAAELAECMRYYYQSNDNKYGQDGLIIRRATNIDGGTNSYCLESIDLPVPMRITPTITVYDDDGNANCVKEMYSNTQIQNTSIRYANNRSFCVSEEGGAFIGGKSYFFNYTASADL